ncbi:MAG: DUF2730 family protein [Pseudomonadota bacterium]
MTETIDWNAARFFWDLLSALFMGGVAIYVWWINRTRATGAALREVHGRIDQVDKHIARIEQTLDSRPGYAEIDVLRSEMATISRGMAEISAQMQSTTALLGRLHEYLLTEKGNAR